MASSSSKAAAAAAKKEPFDYKAHLAKVEYYTIESITVEANGEKSPPATSNRLDGNERK